MRACHVGKRLTKPMAGIYEDVVAMHSFLAAHGSSAASEDFSRVRADMCRSLTAKLGTAIIDMNMATKIINEIQEGPWAVEQRRTLQTLVTQQMTAPRAASTSNGTQTLLHFDQYISKDLAAILRDEASPQRAKFMKAASLLVDIGCVNPSEKTIQTVVATTALAVLGPVNVEQMNGMCKLNITNDFKSMVKMHKKSRPMQQPSLAVFPCNAQAWGESQPEAFAKIYGDDGPVDLNFPLDVLAGAVQMWPMRKAATSVKTSQPAGYQQMPVQFAPFFQMMQQMMQIGQQERAPGQLGLQMLNTPTPSKRNKAVMSLEDLSPEEISKVPEPKGKPLQAVEEKPLQAVEEKHFEAVEKNEARGVEVPESLPKKNASVPVAEIEEQVRQQLRKREREGEETRTRIVSKRPASASASSTSSTPATGTCTRPTWPRDFKPISYLNGRIYTLKKENRFRGFSVLGDSKDFRSTFIPGDEESIAKAWAVICQKIEEDPRNNQMDI